MPSAHGLASRLEMRFGLGDFPLVQRRLYRRLEQLCLSGDAQAQAIITECGMAATTKNFPRKWFAAAVTRRLGEAGYACSEGIASKLRTKEQVVAELAERFAIKAEDQNA